MLSHIGIELYFYAKLEPIHATDCKVEKSRCKINKSMDLFIYLKYIGGAIPHMDLLYLQMKKNRIE